MRYSCGMANEERKGPVSRSRRFARLASMTVGVAARTAATKVKTTFQSAEDAARSRADSYRDSGERIAQTLGELKGAAMKIGQMASVAGDILPKELSSALTRLQKSAPPMPYDVIAAQIESELGSPPELLFEHFDPEPFAAASIGQVHRARVDDGREVVVKVQYPGVDESVDSDLAQLKLALRASGMIQLDRQSFNLLFEELRLRLHEELDYCNEADNVRLFGEFHAPHPHVVVPEVVGERSSQRVLTLTFEPGDSLEQACAYPDKTRDRIGIAVWRLMCDQLFDLQAIHADPNPANFAFRPDGKVVMYDYGCVKRVPPEVVTAYADMAYAGVIEDYQAVHQALDKLGVLRKGGPRVDDSYYKRWRDLIYDPFRGGQLFDYGTTTLHDDVVAMIPGVMRRIASFSMPVELVMIDRMISGHYANLRILKPKGRYEPLVLPYIEGASSLVPDKDLPTRRAV